MLTDGFPRRGLPAPGLAVWKGDRVSASIAAASVLAKVTRDRIMAGLHEQCPAYDFDGHKGYVTPVHKPPWTRTDRARSTASPTSTWLGGCAHGADARVPARTLLRLEDGAVDEDADVDVDSRRRRHDCGGGAGRMSAEDLEKYETEMELQLYREYRDVVGLFSYVVETERRFYLTNSST